jgi:hypothetical protein
MKSTILKEELLTVSMGGINIDGVHVIDIEVTMPLTYHGGESYTHTFLRSEPEPFKLSMTVTAEKYKMFKRGCIYSVEANWPTLDTHLKLFIMKLVYVNPKRCELRFVQQSKKDAAAPPTASPSSSESHHEGKR